MFYWYWAAKSAYYAELLSPGVEEISQCWRRFVLSPSLSLPPTPSHYLALFHILAVFPLFFFFHIFFLLSFSLCLLLPLTLFLPSLLSLFFSSVLIFLSPSNSVFYLSIYAHFLFHIPILLAFVVFLVLPLTPFFHIWLIFLFLSLSVCCFSVALLLHASLSLTCAVYSVIVGFFFFFSFFNPSHLDFSSVICHFRLLCRSFLFVCFLPSPPFCSRCLCFFPPSAASSPHHGCCRVHLRTKPSSAAVSVAHTVCRPNQCLGCNGARGQMENSEDGTKAFSEFNWRREQGEKYWNDKAG